MGLLEFANFTVPDVVKKSIPSFYAKDPMLEAVRSRGKVVRSGGTNVRFTRIKSGHSDISELTGSNLEIPLAKRETFDTGTGDWTRLVKPIILPHLDRDRMQSNADKKRWVQDTTMAVLQSFHNQVSRQLYVGDVSALSGLGTLNGAKTGLSSQGFENGALRFMTPTAQEAAATTYLGITRNEDLVLDENNWYNQFADHSGFSGTYLEVAEQLKITADSYASDSEGISVGVLGIADHVELGKGIRQYGSGDGITYRPDDLEAGKAHRTIYVANGIKYFPNRFMTTARMSAVKSGSEFVYLLNPNGVEWWVNANNDFRVTKFSDHTVHGNMDADIAYCFLEVQLCVPALLTQACTFNTP
tara:strand:+ start:701 stop:1774 length:1074 start_codon:yes stop_codon:yes gene_type:complete